MRNNSAEYLQDIVSDWGILKTTPKILVMRTQVNLAIFVAY